MIRCVRCGAENPDDNNFCDQCGSMLSTSKVESNGTVRNRNNSTVGKIDSDGTVRDSNNHTIGYAKGVHMKYAAVYFFFGFF